MERVHLLITGRVQGVWYRASTRAEAQRLGLGGWVRNLADGRGEAMAEGERATLDALVTWCRRGPRLASVKDVVTTWAVAGGDFTVFEVRANSEEPE